jgi:hypothetical protein
MLELDNNADAQFRMVDNSALLFDPDRLDVHKLAYPKLAQLATVT